jgi:hypothetical protein
MDGITSNNGRNVYGTWNKSGCRADKKQEDVVQTNTGR